MKKVFAAIIALLFILILSGCGRALSYVVDHEPSFNGVIEETHEKYIMVRVNEDDPLRLSSDIVEVSLNTEFSDNLASLATGNEITVYYDGTIQEIYPARIPTVYAIVPVAAEAQN